MTHDIRLGFSLGGPLGRKGKWLEVTGIDVKPEQLHVHEMSHIVPISNQTPPAPWQRCEGEYRCLKTCLLFFGWAPGLEGKGVRVDWD
jgi:hypothetical protein